MNNKRPVYLNLFKIRLPLAGMVSLAHRASGVLLFLAIPFSVYLLHMSTVSVSGFDNVLSLFDNLFIKLINTSLLWAIAHHFFTGLRFLLIDADIGVEKQQANFSAKLVVFLELVLFFSLLCWVW